ncbi:hypothetical protein ACEZ3G_02505 [Maribacter algicola]|uniref:Uncharacterized protein n=1 Tax=Meishania litoralis TaxID=3434685 RepID=A0ACC7LFU1_9FLAO
MRLKSAFFLRMVLGIHVLSAQVDSMYPELPKSGKEMHDLIPDGWQVLSQASGDLNRDGYVDLAFAIQSPVKKTIQYTDDIENDTIVTSPRTLGIYFGKRNGKFKKVLQSNTLIINRKTPAMDEPFKGVYILPNGDLQLDFYIWPCRECTSWTSHEYLFRYQNRAFELIKYEENVTQRVSGEDIHYSVDFLNGSMKTITETRTEDDEREYLEEEVKFELQQLKSIKTLVKPFEWEFQQLRI